MCKSVPAVLLNEDRCGLGDGGSLGGGQCQGHTTRPQCCQLHGSKHRHPYQYTLYLRLQLNRIARHVVNIYFLLLEIFSLS